jgi:hypothetical protein
MRLIVNVVRLQIYTKKANVRLGLGVQDFHRWSAAGLALLYR